MTGSGVWGEATIRLGCSRMNRVLIVWKGSEAGWGGGVCRVLTLTVSSALQENGHVKSNGDLSPKGEGESPPVNGTEEATGATGDTIEPAPPSQGAEAKGDVPPKETPKKKKKFSFKKPFKLSGLSFKRNRKEGGGESSASSPTEEEGSVDPPEFTPGLKWEDTDSKTIQKFYSIFSTLEQEGLRGMAL